jgi:rhodanese-related sulfurtransferase
MTFIICKISISSMAKVITKQQVHQIQPGRLKMIDIRSKEEYEKLHIPEAINIPAEDLAKKLTSFNKDDTIVCVCTYGKERGQQAAELLSDAGCKNAFYLEGGTVGWNDMSET